MHEKPAKKATDELATAATAPPPDGGWGWVVVASSFLIHIIVDGITYAFGVLFKALLQDFHSGKGETAWILSIFVGLTLGAGPLASVLINRYNCRIVTIAGSVIGALGFLISPFAPALWYLYLSLGVVAGIGFGLIYMPAIVIVGYYFEQRRAIAIGIAVAGSGFGTFIFAPLIEFLVEEYGWKQSCLLLSGILLNCILCGALFRPLPIEMRQTPSGKCKQKRKSASEGKRQACTNEAPKQPLVPAVEVIPAEDQDSTADRKVAQTCSDGLEAEDALLSGYAKSDKGTEIRSLGDHSTHLPLHKKDALYSSSLHNIPLYVSNHDLYVASNVSMSSLALSGKPVAGTCCSADMTSTFRGMIDVRLLKDAAFILFLASNFLTNFGFNAPFLYVPDRATEEGHLEDQDAAFLLSIIGIANTAGRILFGGLADVPRIKPYRLHIYNTGLVIAGLATALSSLSQAYWTSVVYCCVFGVFIGCYVSLTSVILVDLLGLDRLTSSFGMTLLVQGVAVVIGPPACGELRDSTRSYQWPFITMGLSIGISGAMLYFIPCLPESLTSVTGSDKRHDEEMGKVIGIHPHSDELGQAQLAKPDPYPGTTHNGSAT